MSYNLTMIGANSTGIVGFMQGVNNNLVSGLLGVFFLIAAFAITFIAFMQTTGDTTKAFTASSFLAFIFSVFLRALGLLPDLALFITLMAAAVGIGFSWRRS